MGITFCENEEELPREQALALNNEAIRQAAVRPLGGETPPADPSKPVEWPTATQDEPEREKRGSIVPAVLMERIYLFVPPEEYAEVEASGACWDDASKRWYIDGDGASAAYSRWLGDEEEPGFGIASEEAFVASAQTSCVRCRESIEVICIYCESGTDCELGEPLRQFTVSNVWAMDGALAAQIARWRFYGRGLESSSEEGCFTNHCPHCGAAQEDYLLHAEPGDVFFGLSRADPGPVEFTQLEGRVEVSGDYSFEV